MVWKLTFYIELTVLDQFLIGSGNPSTRGANIALTCIEVDGRKILPSSTLKGIIRKACNRVVNLVDPNWKPCDAIEPGEVMRRCSGKEHEWLKIFFGVPGQELLSSSVRFMELILEEPVSIHLQRHISIDSRTQTVRRGALYSVEYLPPNTRITTNIKVYVKEKDEDSYGVPRDEAAKYLKLLLLSLIEAPVVGLGRGSKSFSIHLRNVGDIKEFLKAKNILDLDLEELLTMLSKPYSPYTELMESEFIDA